MGAGGRNLMFQADGESKMTKIIMTTTYWMFGVLRTESDFWPVNAL